MAGTLKMCLMCHIEGREDYDESDAVEIGWVASAIGSFGAKMSLQIGRKFVDPAEGYPVPSGSSLSWVIAQHGNFWLHGHDTSAEDITSTYACVRSAYVYENAAVGNPCGLTAEQMVSGRSGGAGSGQDWVSVTVNMGLRRMNSATNLAYDQVPQSARPYSMTSSEVHALYHHVNAPGPWNEDISTMRVRPFWVENSSTWAWPWEGVNPSLNTIYPHEDLVSSIVMVPQPQSSMLSRNDIGYSADTGGGITDENLRACVTQIWTTYQYKVNRDLDSITGVWYDHFKHTDFDSAAVRNRVVSFVQTVNEVMDVHGVSPKGEWANMNEICDLFSCYKPADSANSSCYF